MIDPQDAASFVEHAFGMVDAIQGGTAFVVGVVITWYMNRRKRQAAPSLEGMAPRSDLEEIARQLERIADKLS